MTVAKASSWQKMAWVNWLTLLRITKLSLGMIWAGTLILFGLWLWHSRIHIEALIFLAMGEYILMFMVIDDLCPYAPSVVTGFFKITAALIFFYSLVYLGYLYSSLLIGVS